MANQKISVWGMFGKKIGHFSVWGKVGVSYSRGRPSGRRCSRRR